MSPVERLCGQCQGRNFPEGMRVYYCPACKNCIHPGCWEAHVRHHHDRQDDDIRTETLLEPRRGKISAYGIIQWDN